MDISIVPCGNSDICAFGKNQKKIFRKKASGLELKEITLCYMANKQNPERRHENPNEDDEVWLSFPTPISKRELTEILNKLNEKPSYVLPFSTQNENYLPNIKYRNEFPPTRSQEESIKEIKKQPKKAAKKKPKIKKSKSKSKKSKSKK